VKGKRTIGRFKRRWENNIMINLREIVWENMNWIHMAKDRDQWLAVVITATDCPVP
jgi:hypothetical protein